MESWLCQPCIGKLFCIYTTLKIIFRYWFLLQADKQILLSPLVEAPILIDRAYLSSSFILKKHFALLQIDIQFQLNRQKKREIV
ncbi:hypothetical protein NIES593_13985 [Hydrococcus rivularis NIES-593]|uniref:Uncharacterized protein n=1 Tax=Hydrococcus rivularis NIES-593 TaxID=1921803 RepID=A0A1U7HEP6_9CYAN|nr:hypothetical protein [Hydrococcus rivularis]OKH22039.1 hypothetical protein NIES593_13985 [Hydrococcus rivularis NIES-593]